MTYNRAVNRLLAILLSIAIALAGGCQETTSNAPPPPLATKIDLNRATVKQLEALPGIGEVRARSIVASRNARGGRFERIEDLLKIDGIGEKTLETIRPYIELQPK